MPQSSTPHVLHCRITSAHALGMIVAAAFFAYIRGGWTIFTEYMLATAPQGNPPPLFSSSSFSAFCAFPSHRRLASRCQIERLRSGEGSSRSQPVSSITKAVPIVSAQWLSRFLLQAMLRFLRVPRLRSSCHHLYRHRGEFLHDT